MGRRPNRYTLQAEKDGIMEILNLRSKGGQVKPYQVRQVRHLIPKYKLGEED